MEDSSGSAIPVKFDVRLVEKVRDHAVIYDSKHEHYKNKAVKDEIWKSIGQDLGYLGDDCQYRWRVIRDRYVKKKKEMLRKPGVSEEKIVSTWTLFYQVDDFLSPYIVHRHRLQPAHEELMYLKEEDSASPQIPVLDEGSTPPYVSFETALDESVDGAIDGNSDTRPPKLSHYNSDLDISYLHAIGADGSIRPITNTSNGRKRRSVNIKEEDAPAKQFIHPDRFAMDEETHFGCIVASTLKRLQPKQRALAKLKLTELLYRLEFPEESPIEIEYNKNDDI